jgi:hypothetical protein
MPKTKVLDKLFLNKTGFKVVDGALRIETKLERGLAEKEGFEPSVDF